MLSTHTKHALRQSLGHQCGTEMINAIEGFADSLAALTAPPEPSPEPSLADPLSQLPECYQVPAEPQPDQPTPDPVIVPVPDPSPDPWPSATIPVVPAEPVVPTIPAVVPVTVAAGPGFLAKSAPVVSVPEDDSSHLDGASS